MKLPSLRFSLPAALLLAFSSNAIAAPVVLELFTSQSCSSCPPADALMKRIAQNDPSVLVLSYHVDYWDHLSWRDTYSSPASTQRQRSYGQTMGLKGVFTPQLIINGLASMVGSNEREVIGALAKAKQTAPELTLSIKPEAGKLAVSLSPQVASTAELWEVRFDPYAKTQVKAGENGGRMLESVNNVTSIKRLDVNASHLPIMIESVQEGGVAILAQAPSHGRILGAAFYLKP